MFLMLLSTHRMLRTHRWNGGLSSHHNMKAFGGDIDIVINWFCDEYNHIDIVMSTLILILMLILILWYWRKLHRLVTEAGVQTVFTNELNTWQLILQNISWNLNKFQNNWFFSNLFLKFTKITFLFLCSQINSK